MGIKTEKYIRKPLYVDATRITERNFDEMVAWCSGEVQIDGPKKFIRVFVQNPKNPRQTKAFVGDWLLWTEKSGFKVYTNAAFHRSFDLANPPEDVPQPLTDLEMAEVADGTTPQGEPHEIVEATPQAIADVVNEQQPSIEDTDVEEGEYYPPPIASSPTPDATVAPEPDAPRLQEETGEDHKLKHEPQIPEEAGGRAKLDVGGKRVLTRKEQVEMDREEIQTLLRSGEAVLEQDLAA